MNVTVNAWKKTEKTSFFTRFMRNTDDPMTLAISALWQILRECTGEFTEGSEIEAMGLERIEIIFT